MTIDTLANSSPQNITVEDALFCLIDEGCIPEFDSSYDEIDRKITYYLRCHTNGSFAHADNKDQFNSSSLVECMIKAARTMVVKRIYRDKLT